MITRLRASQLQVSAHSDEIPPPPPPPPTPDSYQLAVLWDDLPNDSPPRKPHLPTSHPPFFDRKLAIMFCEDHPFPRPRDCYPILRRDPLLLLHFNHGIAKRIYHSRFDEAVLVQCCMLLPTTEARVCISHTIERVMQSHIPDEDWANNVLGCSNNDLVSQMPSQARTHILDYWESHGLL